MSRGGFTLIEVVAGLVAAGLVLAAGYAALTGVLDLRERAAQQVELASRAAAVRRVITQWLADAYLVPGGDGASAFVGIDRERAGVADDELSFLTNSAWPFLPGMARVRLFIDRDGATPERGLVAELSAWSTAEGRRLELVPGAVGLDARYLFDGGGRLGWLPSWFSSVELPAAAELRIVAGSEEELPALFRLPVLVLIGG